MTDELIKVGDVVNVVFDDSRMENARVIHAPQGEGDLFQVSWVNKVYAINPYNSRFRYFERQFISRRKHES